jgi:hypothetical protein
MALIRNGMWARVGGKFGIVAQIGPYQDPRNQNYLIPAGAADFHEVAQEDTEINGLEVKAGQTIGTFLVDIRAISQAAFLDIPESRRPSEELARQLGYLG